MRLPHVQIKDTILARFTRMRPDEIRSGILVPINSSTNACNSLEYALNLAKILNNTIHLFYVIDVDINDLSESTIVAHRVLERTYRKAATCVESLKEMIEESGVKVVTAESKIGNIASLIRRQVEYVNPGMVVIGRDCFARNTIHNLINHSTCPVIVVPEAASPKLPSSIILTSEKNTFSEKAIDPLIKIIRSTTQELTIVKFGKSKNSRIEKVAVPYTNSSSVMLNFEQIEDKASIDSLNDFVWDNAVDLVCTVYEKTSLLNRFLGRGYSKEIVFGLDIPVLIARGI